MFRTLWLATEWRAEAAHADTLSSPRWRFLGSRPGRRNPRGTVTNLPPKAPNTHTHTHARRDAQRSSQTLSGQTAERGNRQKTTKKCTVIAILPSMVSYDRLRR